MLKKILKSFKTTYIVSSHFQKLKHFRNFNLISHDISHNINRELNWNIHYLVFCFLQHQIALQHHTASHRIINIHNLFEKQISKTIATTTFGHNRKSQQVEDGGDKFHFANTEEIAIKSNTATTTTTMNVAASVNRL